MNLAIKWEKDGENTIIAGEGKPSVPQPLSSASTPQKKKKKNDANTRSSPSQSQHYPNIIMDNAGTLQKVSFTIRRQPREFRRELLPRRRRAISNAAELSRMSIIRSRQRERIPIFRLYKVVAGGVRCGVVYLSCLVFQNVHTVVRLIKNFVRWILRRVVLILCGRSEANLR